MAALLFFLLLAIYARGCIGGGDAKLLVALALGFSLAGMVQVLTVMSLAGGALAMVHLTMRRLPAPVRAPTGSSLLRRVCAAERWRCQRGAQLPYGVAIACGGIWVLIRNGV